MVHDDIVIRVRRETGLLNFFAVYHVLWAWRRTGVAAVRESLGSDSARRMGAGERNLNVENPCVKIKQVGYLG